MHRKKTQRYSSRTVLFPLLKHTRAGQEAKLPPPHPKYGERENVATQILLVPLKPDAPGHFENNLTPGHHRSPADPLPGPPPVLTGEPLGNKPGTWCETGWRVQGVRGNGGGGLPTASRPRAMCVKMCVCETFKSVFVTAGLHCVCVCELACLLVCVCVCVCVCVSVCVPTSLPSPGGPAFRGPSVSN